MSDIGNFIHELQRRSVIRAAILHLLFFWLLVQVADVVLPYIGVVDEPVRWAVVAGVGLFPLTLAVAWFFEHPWRRYTRGRVATDILLIVLIGVGAGSWVLRNLPQVVHTRTSIVVLPFANSGDTKEASLSRALVSEINSLLMKTRSIDVTGFESASSSTLRGLDASTIAERLNVQHVLSGSISARNGNLHIDMQLLDRAGNALWDSVIDDRLDNLFSIQEDIATLIEARLGAGDDTVPVADVAAKRCWMPNDPKAIEQFYTARYYTELRTETDDAQQKLVDAIQLYRELIADYPDFAEAYSGLAWALAYQATYDRENAVENWRQEGAALATLALTHCPTLGEAMHITPNPYDHENVWIGEHRQLIAFIEMEPQRTENYQRLSFHYRQTGLLERSLDVARRNYQRNPLSVRAIKEYASALQSVGQLEEAAQTYDLATELGSTGPNFSRRMIPLSACEQSDLDCVVAAIGEAFAPPFDFMLFDGWQDFYRQIYAIPTNGEEAAAAIEAAMSRVRSGTDIVNWLNVSACRYEHLTPLFFELFDYVDNAGNLGRDWFWANTWRPTCANVWAQPEFRDYVETSGFVKYWREVGWPEACRPEGDSFACGPE